MNHLLFSYGDKDIVQKRLTNLIVSLQEHADEDRMCYLFARLCKLVVSKVMRALVATKRLMYLFRSMQAVSFHDSSCFGL